MWNKLTEQYPDPRAAVLDILAASLLGTQPKLIPQKNVEAARDALSYYLDDSLFDEE